MVIRLFGGFDVIVDEVKNLLKIFVIFLGLFIYFLLILIVVSVFREGLVGVFCFSSF